MRNIEIASRCSMLEHLLRKWGKECNIGVFAAAAVVGTEHVVFNMSLWNLNTAHLVNM
jgi:hypothetical protein